MGTCSTWSEDVHVVLGLSCHYFFFQLFAFFQLSFSLAVTWWPAQLLLQFYTKLFETLQVFLSWSDVVHVLLGLSSYHFFFMFSGLDYYQNRYLVCATHPTVFHPSFLNYAYMLYMVRRCACGFQVIFHLFFINFSTFWLSFFQVQLLLE